MDELQQAPNPIDPLDALIDHEHGQAIRDEEDALAIGRRLCLISGLPPAWHALARGHGQTRNPYQKGSPFYSLTARAMIEAADPALASFLARKAGTTIAPIDYAAREREEARQKSIQHLQEETERLRQANEFTRQRQAAERHASLPNRPGSGASLL